MRRSPLFSPTSLVLGSGSSRWATDIFPSCGCDACHEMPDEEFERFTQLLSDVVAGRFRESLYLERGVDGWRTSEFTSDDHRSARKTRVPRDEVSQILNGEAEVVLEWMPWQPKPRDAATR